MTRKKCDHSSRRRHRLWDWR